MIARNFANTKDLRKFLLDQMSGVADGTVTAEQTKGITNIAQQVYNTLNIELKTALAAAKLGDATVKPVQFDE